MTKVYAIRAEPGLSATVETGRGLGLDIRGYPLSRVEPVDWEAPSADRFDGLLVGSANAFRHGGRAIDNYLNLPVLAVGDSTAQMAQTFGFTVEKTGEGGLQALLDSLEDEPRHLLRLTGKRNVELAPPPGVRITERVVYRTIEQQISEEFAESLGGNALILLYSAGAAVHFSAECERLGLLREKIALAALGPRILAAAGKGWLETQHAVNPTETDLLALAREMCH